MKLIGLTGGVGMGKSTSAQFLGQMGIPLVDSDRLAREVVEPGQPALDEIVRAFGDSVLLPDGHLDRPALARIVFADAEKRRELESLVHPRIRERWLAQSEGWRRQGVPAGVVVIPLLFETDAAEEFDYIICIACSARSQRLRLRQRQWDDAQIEQRIRAQWSIEQKMDAADYVIWTESTLEKHREQLQRILDTIGVPVHHPPVRPTNAAQR